MTEREIPDGLGFLFGGMTNSDSSFAPPVLSEPEITATPVYASRREARAAGAYQVPAESVDAAAPALSAPPVVTPVSTTPPVPRAPEPEATQAMDVAAIFGLAASPIAPGTTFAPSAMPSPAHAPFASATPTAGRAAATRRGDNGARSAQRPASRAADRKTLRQRLTGTGVMLLVGGLFAVLALPAYADNNATSLTDAIALRSQKLTVNAAEATSATATVARDGYTATSAQDLKKLYADAVRQRNLTAYMQSGAKAQGDDYPWFAELSRNQGGGLSPLNYYYRECVDFVAWRLNRDAGSTTAPFKWVWSTLTPSGGNASQWKSAWLNHGWPTGTTPKVGAVAWFPYNHVAYVSGILNDGSVAVEEYNWQGQHVYGTRIIQPGDAYYLYAPPA
jgi:surface antigen